MIRLLLLLPAAALAANGPSFECKDAAGSQYQLFLRPNDKRLVVTEKGATRTYTLTDANLGKPSEPGAPLAYVARTQGGRTVYSLYDFSVEARTHFFRYGEGSAISVSLLLDHREVPKLSCTAKGYRAPVVDPGTKTPLVARLAEPLLRHGYDLDPSGRMAPIAILALEASLIRAQRAGLASEPVPFGELAELVGPTLKKLPPMSVQVALNRLIPADRKFAQSLLERVGYRYYPEAQRFADWVIDGQSRSSGPDWIKVQAGLTSFVRSPLFAKEDFRTFFASEVRKVWDKVPPEAVPELTASLKPDQVTYVMELWADKGTRAKFRTYLEVQPEVGGMVKELTRELKPAEKGVRSHFSSFLTQQSRLARMPGYRESDFLRAYVRSRVGPHLVNLKPKEFEVLRSRIHPMDLWAFDELAADRYPAGKPPPPPEVKQSRF